MYKRISIIIFFIFSFSILFATSNDCSLTGVFGLTTGKSVESDTIIGEFFVEKEILPFNLLTGLQITKVNFCTTSQASYIFKINKIISLSPEILYSYQRLFNLSNEHNIIFGLHTFIKPTKNFSINLRNSFLLKFSSFNSLPELKYIREYYPTFQLLLTYQFNKISITGSLLSYDYFNFPLFCLPQWSLNVTYSFNKAYAISLNTSVHYSDMFTLTAYIDSVIIKAAFIYTF